MEEVFSWIYEQDEAQLKNYLAATGESLVGIVDTAGDTVLHAAVQAEAPALVEIILKHVRLTAGTSTRHANTSTVGELIECRRVQCSPLMCGAEQYCN